jgi:Holliday junction resolvase RusA-like endonuclease
LEETLDNDDEENESMSEDTQTGETILDITVVPFEPITPGSGHAVADKQSRLAKAISDKIQAGKLAELRKERANRVVTLTVLFYLWKGSPKVTDTRPVKDIDNLLKVLLDVLGSGPQGLGILESDSFISELYASKQFVGSEEEEGYRIVVEEYKDEEMLRTLKAHSENKQARAMKS